MESSAVPEPMQPVVVAQPLLQKKSDTNTKMIVGIVLLAIFVVVLYFANKKNSVAVAPVVGLPVFALGPDGTAPWGTGANFVDPTAQFIWNKADAAAGAPAETVTLAGAYNNITGSAMSAMLHGIVDNESHVACFSFKAKGSVDLGSINGGWGNKDYTRLPVTLLPGVSVIVVTATNTLAGPAGVLMSLISADNKVLLNTNAIDWFSGSSIAFDGKVMTLS